MNDITYGFIGLLLIIGIFIIPILRDIRNILKDSLTLKIKENEMIASLHDKVMEIRNIITDSEKK
ncbi:MAG: hypothetical protein WC850_02255 [Candidatus Gracilibacteria bacterium]